MTDLSKSVIIVVGGAGGLGSRIASRLSAAGATVEIASRASGWDLRDPGMPARLVESVTDRHDRLDGVVIAAGAVAFGPAAEVADDTLAELFEVNATGPIRLIRAATPALRASAEAGREPFVITLSGIVSETPTAGIAAYSAAKAALAAFVQAASRELRKPGIRLIDARPGHVETELSQHPIAGETPKMPEGHDPEVVADRIVRAIAEGEGDLPSTAFTA